MISTEEMDLIRTFAEKSFHHWDGKTFSCFDVPSSAGRLFAMVPGEVIAAEARLAVDDPLWMKKVVRWLGTARLDLGGTGLRVKNRIYFRVMQ